MTMVYDVPDQGYSWVILGASWWLQFLTASCYAPFGIIIVEYISHFEVSKALATWIGGVLYSLTGTLCIFIGPLVARFSYRTVTIAGSVLVAMAYILSSLAPNFYILFLTHGIIGALGYSCFAISSQTALQHFFLKRRSLAIALASTGINCGVFVWSPLMSYLITEYAWRGALLLLGAINFNGIACALFLRAPNFAPKPAIEEITSSPADVQQEEQECDVCDEEDRGIIPSSPPLEKQHDGFIEDGSNVAEVAAMLKESDNDHPIEATEDDVNVQLEVDASGGQISLLSSSQNTQNNISSANKNVDNVDDGKVNTQHQDDDIKRKTTDCAFCSIFKICRDVFDVSLLKNVTLVLYGVAALFTYMGHYSVYTFLPLRTNSLQIPRETGALMISLVGVSMAVFRILFGWLADKPWVSRPKMFSVAAMLTGLITAGSVLATDTTGIAVYCALFAFLAAIYGCVTVTLIADIVGLKKLEAGCGLVFCLMGLGMFVSTPLGGVMVDQTGDTGMPFLVLGLAQFLGGAISVSIIFLLSKRPLLCGCRSKLRHQHKKPTNVLG